MALPLDVWQGFLDWCDSEFNSPKLRPVWRAVEAAVLRQAAQGAQAVLTAPSVVVRVDGREVAEVVLREITRQAWLGGIR